MTPTNLVELHRLELMTRMWQLSQENPDCTWLQATVIMNLPTYRLDTSPGEAPGATQFDAHRN